MKWSRSNKMKESFNCVTHPHSTSCGELSKSSAGTDLVMSRPRTMRLQMIHTGFTVSALLSPRSHPATSLHPSPHTDLRHKHTQKVSHTQASNKPGSPKRQSMAPYCGKSSTKSLGCSKSSDVGYTPNDKAQHRYWLMLSTICGASKRKNKTKKTRQIQKCHLVTFWRS